MKRPLFNDIKPLKNNRITRSHLKQLQQIKRVINVDHDKDNFQHFSSVSISVRIPTVSAITKPEAEENLGFSKKFLDRHYINMDGFKPRVTIVPRNQLLSDVVHLKKNCEDSSNNNIDKTKQNDVIIDITGDISVDAVDIDDDVIIVPNPAEELVINLDESISYIPLETFTTENKLLKENINENKICPSNLSDTNEDIIFVSENTPKKNNSVINPTHLKLSLSNMRKSTSNTKHNLNTSKNVNVKRLIPSKQKFKRRRKKIRKTNQLLSKNIQNVLSKELMSGNLQSLLSTKCNCEVQTKTCCTPLVSKIVNRFQAKQNSPKLSLSFNDFQNNMCNIQQFKRMGLREIVIDGSNVAIGHSNHRFFSVKGLQIAIEYFLKKGHKVTAFVPQYRQKLNQTSDRALLNKLADKGYVVFTPSREINGKRITPYDDRYIVQYATACEGIIVSSDNYRDLFLEKPEWRQTIEKRLLMPTWIGDVLMFPEDPLGRDGPTLSSFLSFP